MEKIRIDVEWCEKNFCASFNENVLGAIVITATTIDELKKEAIETLRFHIEGMIEDVTLDLNLAGAKVTGTATIDGVPQTVDIPLDGGNLATVLSEQIAQALNAPTTGVIAQIEKSIQKKITNVVNSAKDTKEVHAADKMISFLNKTIEFLATKVDNVNYYMEPVMFWGNKDAGYHHLSSLKSAPTYVNGSSMDFYATTYTADVLNPAFKKAIVVKNLTTNATVTKGYDVSKNGSKSLTINKAFDGGIREVSVVFPASGLYEITYAAIDYHGNVVEIPYYVNVTL